MPYLGGYEIRSVEWAGRNAVRVAFRADGWDAGSVDRYYQLYAGRRLIAVTDQADERTLVGAVPFGVRATPLWICVVTLSERLTEFGYLAGWLPINAARVRFQAPDPVPADLHHFDVCLSPAAGEEADLANVVGRLRYDSAREEYTFDLPPFATGGEWSVAIVGRDDAKPEGNAGEPLTGSIAAVVYPLDVVLQQDGSRLTGSVANGVLSVGFQWPEDAP